MTKNKENLELYYIEKKIKNELIDNIFAKWNIDSINFLLSIFSEKKYKKFHNTCLSILFDYVKWFKYENNYLYNRSYYPTDLDYIYSLISNDLLNNTNINVNYIEKLEIYIKTENINNKAFYYPNNYPNNYSNNYSNNYPNNYPNNYIDTSNEFSSNFNFFYIMEIIFFIFILAILFFIKYIYSCINISNKPYKKLEFENQYPIGLSGSFGNFFNDKNTNKVNSTSNIINDKINNLFNSTNPITSDGTGTMKEWMSPDILFSKITSLLEKDDFKDTIKDTIKDNFISNLTGENEQKEKSEKTNNNQSFLDFISLMKNCIL